MLPIRYIFMSLIPNNLQITPHKSVVYAQQSFHAQKITEKMCKYLPFTSRKNDLKENSEFNIFLSFFRSPKWAKQFLSWKNSFILVYVHF